MRTALSSLQNAGTLTSPAYVIPESFCDEINDHQQIIDLSEVKTSFNFLLFGQLTGNNPENDRKNIFYTIKWFCETFKNDPDVGLVIKTNSGRKS